MKINSQQLRAAMVCQSVKDVRYYLNGVHIKGNYIEATDGHRAVRMKLANRVRGEYILKIKGRIPKCAKISKFEFSNGENIVKHYDSFGDLVSINTVELLQGKFPDIGEVIEKNKEEGESDSQYGFNAKYMGDMAKMFGDANGLSVSMKQYSKFNTYFLTVMDKTISSLYGDPIYLVMPVKNHND